MCFCVVGERRDARGEGRDIPSAIGYAELQDEGTMNANRSHLPVIVALLCPVLPFALLLALQQQPVVRL